MIRRLTYKLWCVVRLPFATTYDLFLATYDGALDLLIGPSQYGSRREVRSWTKSVKQIDMLEQAETKASKRSADQLKFGQGEVVNHLAEMNRNSAETTQV